MYGWMDSPFLSVYPNIYSICFSSTYPTETQWYDGTSPQKINFNPIKKVPNFQHPLCTLRACSTKNEGKHILRVSAEALIHFSMFTHKTLLS